MKVIQQSSAKLLLLHVWPGAMLFLLFCILAPLAVNYSLPVYFAIFLASLIVSSFQLLFLYRVAAGQKKSVKEVLGYQNRVPLYKYLLYVVVLLIIAIILAVGIASVFEVAFAKWFYTLVPSWFNVAQLSGFSKELVLLVIVGQLLIVSIINPVVEELYFRGYLLKQMERMGNWGIPLHSFLFSLQHFLQPYGLLSRFLIFLPVAYVVKREQNLYIGMVWHCLLNALSILSLIQYL